MTRTELERWADVRNTSMEVAKVIRDAARNRLDNDDLTLETAMQSLWENPSDAEMAAVTAGAFENAGADVDVLYWGEEKLTRPAK